VSAEAVATVSWDSVFAWRMRRQGIDPTGRAGLAETVRSLCGVQAQVASSAELAIALRREAARQGDLDAALAERELMRTWAMRGTLHLLSPEDAGAYLALVGAARSWERPAWQRNFGVSGAEVDALARAVSDILADRVLERAELIDEVAARTGSRALDEHLRSGWSALLKPLAWMGLLCNGPARGGRVTFTSPATWLPSWGGLPAPHDAARIAIPAYLRAHGPATSAAFDAWLTRGSSRREDVREWFAALEERLVTVDVDGHRALLLAEDLDELCQAARSPAVRLLAGFDQYLLGPGTGDPRIVPHARRKQVSKTAGWISAVVLVGGRVAGVWELAEDAVVVSLFEEAGDVNRDALEAEAARVGAFTGRDLRVSVSLT
jgi:hypothetical protein